MIKEARDIQERMPLDAYLQKHYYLLSVATQSANRRGKGGSPVHPDKACVEVGC